MAKVIFILVFFTLFIPVISFGQNEIENTTDTITQEQLDFQLIVTASKGDASTVLFLLGKGANVNATADNGISALMYASQNGHLSVVKTLVANGADVNYFPNYEISSLSSAVINNQYDIVEYLLRKGAKVNLSNNKKITPLMYAAAYGYTPITFLLLQNKADVNIKDIYGNDALIMSVLYNHPDVSDVLLKSGANPNSIDNEKFSPLIIASQNGLVNYFEILKPYNVDFNAKNIDGYSALDMAVINKQPESISNILRIDTIKNKDSNNSVKLAYLSGNRELIPVLRKAGCKPYLFPLFNKLLIGYGIDANFNDLMFGTTVGIKETRYNILFSVSYFTRFWSKRVLIDYGNDMLIQFWERRSYVSFGIDKRFKLSGIGNKQSGISIGGRELFTYGHYRGAAIIPPNNWTLLPNIGFYSEGKSGGVFLNLEYLDLKMENIFPVRINATAYFYIGLKKFNKIIKEPEW